MIVGRSPRTDFRVYCDKAFAIRLISELLAMKIPILPGETGFHPVIGNFVFPEVTVSEKMPENSVALKLVTK